jgi:glycosyltransferase involved in cell wall biosynthesis
MKLAVITPILNSKHNILPCLQSTLHLPVETLHIFVDGGSTDGSLELLESFASIGQLLLVKAPCSGIYEAMNIGAHAAPADSYLLFLGSDDLIISSPPKLFIDTAHTDQIPAAFFPVIQNNLDGGTVSKYPCKLPAIIDATNFLSFPFHHQGYVVLREIFLSHPLLPCLGLHADYSHMIQVANRYACSFYDYAWVCYATGGASDFFSLSNLRSVVKIAVYHRISLFHLFLNMPIAALRLLIRIFLPVSLVRFFRRQHLI